MKGVLFFHVIRKKPIIYTKYVDNNKHELQYVLRDNKCDNLTYAVIHTCTNKLKMNLIIYDNRIIGIGVMYTHEKYKFALRTPGGNPGMNNKKNYYLFIPSLAASQLD